MVLQDSFKLPLWGYVLRIMQVSCRIVSINHLLLYLCSHILNTQSQDHLTPLLWFLILMKRGRMDIVNATQFEDRKPSGASLVSTSPSHFSAL